MKDEDAKSTKSERKDPSKKKSKSHKSSKHHSDKGIKFRVFFFSSPEWYLVIAY